MRPSKLRFFNGGNISDEFNFDATNSNDLSEEFIANAIRSQSMICLDGETDLNRIMSGDFSALKRPDCAFRFDEVFRWAWESWRAAVGNSVGRIYPYAIQLMNTGARNNGDWTGNLEGQGIGLMRFLFCIADSGFYDIGDVWRHETELPFLSDTMASLMKQIKPFHELLHGVLRRVLWKRVHTFEPFEQSGTIPAHILGNWEAEHRWRTLNKWNVFREHVVAELATLSKIVVAIRGHRFGCPNEALELEQYWYGQTGGRFLSIAVIASDDKWILDAIDLREKWRFHKMSWHSSQYVSAQGLQVCPTYHSPDSIENGFSLSSKNDCLCGNIPRRFLRYCSRNGSPTILYGICGSTDDLSGTHLKSGK